MHTLSRSRLTVILSLVTFVGCGPTNDPYAPDRNAWDDVPVALKCDPNNDQQNCIEPRENTVRIDDEDRLKVASASWDAATSELTVTLKQGASLDPRIKVGTILYRSRKDRLPLLHRVETLEKNGQVVKAKLVRVSAKEAFARGRIRARIPITTGAMQQPLTSGVTTQPLEVALGPANCSGTVFDKQVNAPNAQGSVKLDLTKCKFQIMAWVDAILEWDGFLNVDRLELSVGGGVDAAMHAQLIVDLDAQFSESKRIWEGPEVPLSVGGILITINPSLFAGYNLSTSAQLTVTYGFDMTDTVNVGFGWSDRLDWYSIDERDTKFTEFGPNVTYDGNVRARAWIEPRLDVKAFGFVGATVTLRTFAEARMTSTATSSGGTYSGELCTSLDLGVTPTVGAVAELAGIQLFQESVDLATFTTPIVKNRCVPMNGPIPPNCDHLTSECCIDGQCPAPTEPGTTVKCGRGMPTSGGKYNFTCKTVYPPRYCTSDAQCEDPNFETVDICQDYSCAHELRGPDVAASATTSTTTPVHVGSVCIAPACCHSKSDCADGNLATVDRCVKPPNSGPDVAGTCG
ncbi:MAG: hypothetical protein AB1730_16875 [Myxococcota bacterium]